MKKAIAAALMALLVTVVHAEPADACGVKLTVKAPKVRQAARSSNPSTILLLGEDDSQLRRQLVRRGHTVDVASSPEEAKRKDYRLVLADDSHMDEAKASYGDRAEERTSASRVEQLLAREGRSGERTLVARQEDPEILRAGPTAERTPLTASGGGTVAARTPAAPTRASDPPEARAETRVEARAAEPERVATAETEARPERAIEEPEEREPAEPRRAKAATWHREAYFATNSNRLNRRGQRHMRANAAWLEANPDATVLIEGHTDTVGDADYNMMLGERRADAAKEFLMGLGVDGSRIEIVSKGEDEPAYSPGTSGKNRRVVIVKQ